MSIREPHLMDNSKEHPLPSNSYTTQSDDRQGAIALKSGILQGSEALNTGNRLGSSPFTTGHLQGSTPLTAGDLQGSGALNTGNRTGSSPFTTGHLQGLTTLTTGDLQGSNVFTSGNLQGSKPLTTGNRTGSSAHLPSGHRYGSTPASSQLGQAYGLSHCSSSSSPSSFSPVSSFTPPKPGRRQESTSSSSQMQSTKAKKYKRCAAMIESRRLQSIPIYGLEAYKPSLRLKAIGRASLGITPGGKCTVSPFMDEAWSQEQREAHAFPAYQLLESKDAYQIAFDRDVADVITITGYDSANVMIFKAFTSDLASVWTEQGDGIEAPSGARLQIILESIEHRRRCMNTFKEITQFKGFQFLGRLQS